MMRSFAAAALLALLPCAFAQPMRPETVLAATAAHDAAGGAILVRNNSDVTVTAFEYVFTLRDPDLTVRYAVNAYYDSATDPACQAIAPGQQVRVPFAVPFGAQFGQVRTVVGVEAGLFSTGASFGERHIVQMILDRRNYTLVSLGKAIGDLKRAMQDGLTRQQVIAEFQSAANLESSAAANSEIADCVLRVRNQAIAELARGARRPDGNPVPTAEFLQSQIDALSRRRDALREALAK